MLKSPPALAKAKSRATRRSEKIVVPPAPRHRPKAAQSSSPAASRFEQLADQIRVCIECPLCKSRNNAVPGEGKLNAKVMVIGEGPGKQEDALGRPFVGSSGKYLDHVLAGTGISRSDLFITNIVKCRPPSNRTPKIGEVETCTSLYLFEQLRLINPKLVLLLGSVAVKRLLGANSVDEVRGKIVEHEGRKFVATYHPAVRFYREDLAKKLKEDFALLRQEILHL